MGTLTILAALTALLCLGIGIAAFAWLHYDTSNRLHRIRVLRRLFVDRDADHQDDTIRMAVFESVQRKMYEGTPGVDVPPRSNRERALARSSAAAWRDFWAQG